MARVSSRVLRHTVKETTESAILIWNEPCLQKFGRARFLPGSSGNYGRKSPAPQRIKRLLKGIQQNMSTRTLAPSNPSAATTNAARKPLFPFLDLKAQYAQIRT